MYSITYYISCNHIYRLPWWLSSKESTCYAQALGEVGSIPGLGRSPGEEHSNPLQYSCLENPIDRRAWCIILYIYACIYYGACFYIQNLVYFACPQLNG